MIAKSRRSLRKVIIDNNALDRFIALDDYDRDQVVRFFNQRCSFYLTQDLVEEMICIYQSNRRHLLPFFCRFLLDITSEKHNRLYQRAGQIVLDQINGSTNLFLSTSDQRLFEEIIFNVSEGNFSKIEEGAVVVLEYKAKVLSVFEDLLPNLMEIYNSGADIIEPYTTWYARSMGMDRNKGRERVISALKRENSHWVQAHVKAFDSLLRLYRDEGYSPKKGDWYDTQQIVYLAGSDLMISNEKRLLRRIFQDVFRNNLPEGEDWTHKQIITVEEFLEFAKG